MRAVDPFLAELENESASTRRLLEHIPEDKFAFRPHEKAMSLGELAGHVAQVPLFVVGVLGGESFDISEITGPGPAPANREELLAMHTDGVKAAQEFLGGLSDEQVMATWRLKNGNTELMAMPRIAAIRAFLFNHLYHHRGQVSTYLRIAGAHVPSVYGPTADENPFG